MIQFRAVFVTGLSLTGKEISRPIHSGYTGEVN